MKGSINRMYEYLRALKHRGLDDVELGGLGHINILCGKNNSGKTSILEALNSEKTTAIGRKLTIEDIDWLKELFEKHANSFQYNTSIYISWFSEFIEKYIEENPVWYSDEISDIAKDIVTGQEEYSRKSGANAPIPNYESMISKCFENLINKYKTELIPPKRNLNYTENIDSSNNPVANGPFVVNKLFSRKNQLPSSKDRNSYDKIYNYFKEITGHHFDITVQPNNQINILFSRGKEWLDGASCGLGLTDVLIMVFYAIDSEAAMLFIEEPENHLHPEMQKKFLRFLKGVKGKQFMLSTHSNVLLDPYIVDKIFYVFYDGNIR